MVVEFDEYQRTSERVPAGFEGYFEDQIVVFFLNTSGRRRPFIFLKFLWLLGTSWFLPILYLFYSIVCYQVMGICKKSYQVVINKIVLVKFGKS